MPKLIMMRHGESCWNKLNLFSGWVDIPLSKAGIEEALAGGKKIRDIPIDVVFTSTLVRAQTTTFLALSEHASGKVPVVQHTQGKLGRWGKIYCEKTEQEVLPVYYAWQLNERMYGELQGLNKAEMMKQFGEEQVKIWRRSFDVPPPHGESLQMTAKRTIPFFKKTILPRLMKGQNVFVCAHGNSLRSICMHIDKLTPEQVLELEIPTGAPLVYEYSGNDFEQIV